MLIVQVIATLFLISMIYYLIPPLVESIFLAKPSRIIGLTYSALTSFGLLLGFQIVFCKALVGTLHRLLQTIYTPETLESHLAFTIGSTILATSFVVGGLVRSYFNLHNIESDGSNHPLTRLIRGMTKRARMIEFFLRAAMVGMILFAEYKLTNLRNDFIPASYNQFALTAFSSAFSMLWLILVCFYLTLLVWDLVITANVDGAIPADRASVLRLIRFQGIPVHLTGLLVSLSMFLIHKHFYQSTADLIFPLVGLFSFVGICLLAFSLVRDWQPIRRSHLPPTAPNLKTSGQEV